MKRNSSSHDTVAMRQPFYPIIIFSNVVVAKRRLSLASAEVHMAAS